MLTNILFSNPATVAAQGSLVQHNAMLARLNSIHTV